VKNETPRCIANVYPKDDCWHSHQCTRPAGYGKDGMYCKVHARFHPVDDNQRGGE